MKHQVATDHLLLQRADKVLFPSDGLTKRDLLDYYLTVAERLLPLLRDRPVTLERYPDGIERGGFFQKTVPSHLPPWAKTVTVPLRAAEDGRTAQEQLLCNDRRTLALMVDLACITPHVWAARRDALERPDQLLFDLDPAPGGGFASVRRAALLLRDALAALELPAFVKTTGSRGLHVMVPLRRDLGFDTVRAFSQRLARGLVAEGPDELTVEQRKEARGGRLYVDVTRNAYGQTTVAGYAVRARPGAPVALPVPWQWVEDGSSAAQSFRLADLRTGRLPFDEDPWRGWRRHAVDLRTRLEETERLETTELSPSPRSVPRAPRSSGTTR